MCKAYISPPSAPNERAMNAYENLLSPTPWIFRGDPNKSFLVLVAGLIVVIVAALTIGSLR